MSVEYFDEIRIFRKTLTEKIKTDIFEFPLEKLIEFYKIKFGIDVSEKSIRQRYGHICDESKNEGFFADKIILIEGLTEKYSLPLYFQFKNYDIDNEKVSIISAGSVDCISYLYVIFNEFHIPCYVIFDGDKPSEDLSLLTDNKKDDAKNKSKRNKELFELLGVTFEDSEVYLFPDTNVDMNYSIWEKNFESTFHKSLANYDDIKSQAKKLFGNDSKPLTGRYFAETLTEKYPDKISPYIDELITNIKVLTWLKSCLVIEESK